MNDKNKTFGNYTIVLADAFGFCFGVRRAVDLVENARKEQYGKLTTLGPIIHNRLVVNKHHEMGIDFATSLEDINEGTVVMSAHGVAPNIIESAKDKGLGIVDATCPFVTKVQRAAKKMAQEGYVIVIVGDPGHSEVRGVVGTVESVQGVVYTVSKPGEIEDIKLGRKVGVVCQTTQKASVFSEVVAEITKHAYETRVYNTICGATDELQTAATELANKVDIVVVIGGKNSANTRRLKEICETRDKPAYHIETADELMPEWFFEGAVIGITAGASTPDWIINEILGILTHNQMELSDHKLPYDLPNTDKDT